MKDACMGKEVINTSRKLKSLIREEEKLEAKIADMQIRLEEVRKAKKMEEDAEILKSFRSMELETYWRHGIFITLQPESRTEKSVWRYSGRSWQQVQRQRKRKRARQQLQIRNLQKVLFQRMISI